MKFFITANDAEYGNVTYVCHSLEEMKQVWGELGDDVQLVQKSENCCRVTIFERC